MILHTDLSPNVGATTPFNGLAKILTAALTRLFRRPRLALLSDHQLRDIGIAYRPGDGRAEHRGLELGDLTPRATLFGHRGRR
jgi:uncharacterized protein YjiS (DUF1127 family)